MKKFFPLMRAFSGRFLSAAGVIALSIILSRQLSLAEAGLFFEAFITLMGLTIALQFGTPLVILRKIARQGDDPGAADTILSGALSSLSAICAIVTVAWTCFFAMTGTFSTPMALVWLNILPAAVMGPLSAYLKAVGHPGRGGFWEVGVLSLTACAIMLVVQPADAMTAWLAFSAACWIGMIAAVLHAGARHSRALARPVPDLSLLLEGRFLWAMSVLAYISLWGGVLIARWLLDADSTAALNALFRTLAPLQFLILTIDFYMAPKFAAAHGTALRSLYTKARIICAALALPYVAVTLAMPSAFLSLLYGEAYGAFGTELRLIIISIFVQILLGPAGMLLTMQGQDRIILSCMALKATIYLGLSLVLGAKFMMIGIVTALAVATLIQATLQYSIMARIYLTGKNT